MKVVVTTVGKDRVGIIAKESQILAENGVNILNINQNITGGFFNMVMIAELPDNGGITLADLQAKLKELGKEMGLEIKAQHQDIFNIMHDV
ncbi:MAG: ACT domain-containing protein [Selenomonadaceae bacterium]|nr:ACT domain-containing protein [Selenomonadaceae bacterium]MDY2686357.1 ACT domain-containing protein [Selenomonadaceae bacterium]